MYADKRNIKSNTWHKITKSKCNLDLIGYPGSDKLKGDMYECNCWTNVI